MIQCVKKKTLTGLGKQSRQKPLFRISEKNYATKQTVFGCITSLVLLYFQGSESQMCLCINSVFCSFFVHFQGFFCTCKKQKEFRCYVCSLQRSDLVSYLAYCPPLKRLQHVSFMSCDALCCLSCFSFHKTLLKYGHCF